MDVNCVTELIPNSKLKLTTFQLIFGMKSAHKFLEPVSKIAMRNAGIILSKSMSLFGLFMLVSKDRIDLFLQITQLQSSQ